jgi:hypothetical protein
LYLTQHYDDRLINTEVPFQTLSHQLGANTFASATDSRILIGFAWRGCGAVYFCGNRFADLNFNGECPVGYLAQLHLTRPQNEFLWPILRGRTPRQLRADGPASADYSANDEAYSPQNC